MKTVSLLLLASLVLGIGPVTAVQAGLSDFDTSNSVVQPDLLLSGGPPKDGIPAISKPSFSNAKENSLKSDVLVLGVEYNGESKAYPVNILNWHEIVNDDVGGQSVAVTWCPLTKSGLVFDRVVSGETLEFGVSGLLYNSNVVMYDRTYDGLWSQLGNKGISGKFADQKLKILPSVLTTWEQWYKEHPQTQVMSRRTGHWRNYWHDPYHGYHKEDGIVAPITKNDSRLPAKQLVIGLELNGRAKAYPLSIINSRAEPLKDRIGETDIFIHPNDQYTAYVTDKEGNVLPAVVLYWFAWSTFHNDSLLYTQK